MKIGIHVSLLFRRDLSKNPIAEASLERMMTARADPHIMIPPIVGVPDFFACSAENTDDFSPVIACSRICFPILWLIRKFVNGLTAMNVIKNAKNDDPSINVKSFTNSFIVQD